MISAREALERLRQGNRRFVAEEWSREKVSSEARRSQVADGQEPFAVVLGCSDSRVPAEIVFDQGLGDLFVIRVAGNIVARSQVDSVDFAADRLRTRLVVVLGHSQCGAIQATLERLQGDPTGHVRHLRSVIERIRPSVEPLLKGDLADDWEALVRQAVRDNVAASVEQLRRSEELRRLIEDEGLRVVGAEYSLESGVVDFFDDLSF